MYTCINFNGLLGHNVVLCLCAFPGAEQLVAVLQYFFFHKKRHSLLSLVGSEWVRQIIWILISGSLYNERRVGRSNKRRRSLLMRKRASFFCPQFPPLCSRERAVYTTQLRKCCENIKSISLATGASFSLCFVSLFHHHPRAAHPPRSTVRKCLSA